MTGFRSTRASPARPVRIRAPSIDYDSYVDIHRSMIVGGPPAAEIPHTVLQAVLAAEAEEDADEAFTSGRIPAGFHHRNAGYVDYIDQEMVFNHVNEGSMNLGDTTTAAFTISTRWTLECHISGGTS